MLSSHAKFDANGFGMLIRDLENLYLYVGGSNDIAQDSQQSVSQSNAQPLASAPVQQTGFDGIGGMGNLGQPALNQNAQAAVPIPPIPVVNYPIVPAKGGTGLTTIPAHGVMLGEGTSNVATATPGTSGNVLTSNGASADPTFQPVTALVADATTSSKGIVELGGDLAGTGTTAAAPRITANTVTNAKLAQATALTVLGNATNATANRTDIAAASDGQILQRVGTALGFVTPRNLGTGSTLYGVGSTVITVPAGCYVLFFCVKGAGGGGGGTAQMTGITTYGAYGGGEGGTAFGFLNVTPGQSLTLVVGAGGAGGTAGANAGTAGGASSITGTGIQGAAGAGGAGITATGGTIGTLGGQGGTFTTSTGVYGTNGHSQTISSLIMNVGPPQSVQAIRFDGGLGGGIQAAANNGGGGPGATGSVTTAIAGAAGQNGFIGILT